MAKRKSTGGTNRVMAIRRPFSKAVETKVLVASRRRCALCYGLTGDTTEKEGQIAHVDRDAGNAAEENAAWLCLKHHSRYDSRSQQAKGHTPEELSVYRTMLYEHMASPSAWPDAGPSPTGGTGVSLEVFDRRVPMYRATINFLRVVIRGDKLELDPIFTFASATDEALFIFDAHLAEYLSELYKRAVRLHGVYAMQGVESRTRDLSQEWADSMEWFSEQFKEVRRRFAPYLQLASAPATKTLQPAATRPRRRRSVTRRSGRERG